MSLREHRLHREQYLLTPVELLWIQMRNCSWRFELQQTFTFKESKRGNVTLFYIYWSIHYQVTEHSPSSRTSKYSPCTPLQNRNMIDCNSTGLIQDAVNAVWCFEHSLQPGLCPVCPALSETCERYSLQKRWCIGVYFNAKWGGGGGAWDTLIMISFSRQKMPYINVN